MYTLNQTTAFEKPCAVSQLTSTGLPQLERESAAIRAAEFLVVTQLDLIVDH